MRRATDHQSEPERFVESGFDCDPLIRGMVDPSRIGQWQGYARATGDDELLAQLQDRARGL